MTNRATLFAFILGVPIVAFLVAAGVQSHLDSELRSAVKAQYPNADPVRIAKMSVRSLRDEPDPEIHSVYRTYTTLGLMKSTSALVGVIGLGLLLAIWLGGRLAANNRQLLLSLFGPGLYVTAALLICLMAVYAALATMSIYYGESAVAGRVHYFIMASVGLGGIAGVYAVGKSVFGAVSTARTYVIGKTLSRCQAPQFWSHIDEVAKRTGAEPPENLVVGLDPNFFVTEANVTCLDCDLLGRTIYCSLPLARVMTVDELDAVVGHELGHFKGLDTRFSQEFYPIYRGTINSLVYLRETATGWRSIAAMPAVGILTYFLECFSLAETRIGRERELAADKVGADITSPSTAAAALVKIHAFSPAWGSIHQATIEALREGKAFANVSEAFADMAAKGAAPEVLADIAGRRLTHPTDSHPPLGVRLESLKVNLADVADAALAVNPPNPAIDLIPDHKSVEEEVTMAFQAILADRLGIELKPEPESDSPRS
jgi:Zn-dependent protease with chaperone function